MTMLPMGTNPTLPPKGGWRVSTSVESTRRTQGGQLVQGMQVHFLTGYGVTGSIFVPNATVNEQRVRALIAQKVQTLDAISRLSSTTGQ